MKKSITFLTTSGCWVVKTKVQSISNSSRFYGSIFMMN